MYREAEGLSKEDNCPICLHRAHVEFDVKTTLVICPVCGKFRIDLDAEHHFLGLGPEDDARRAHLSYVTRNIAERAWAKRDNSSFVFYTESELSRMLKHPRLSIQEKHQRLLRYFGDLSEFAGKKVFFDCDTDFSVIDATNPTEALFCVQTLKQQRFISLLGGGDKMSDGINVSAEGWLELERISRSGAESVDGFIAMWFDDSRRPFELAITQAITSAGYIPVRMDRVEHLNRIDDEIIARLRRSKFVVADFTGQRNGVYFEAGFMLGLGRPVIWVCDKKDLDGVHFDTRQYNTIDYLDGDDLRKRLQFRIEANLGKGPVEMRS